jgi:hypothetical protein
MKTEKTVCTSELENGETFVSKDPVGIRQHVGSDGLPVLENHPSQTIKTLEQLLEAAKVDLTKYEVERSEVNKWEQMSESNGLVPLFQVKAKLKRKALTNDDILADFREAGEAFAAGKKKAAKIVGAKPTKDTLADTMVEFALPDLHLGKLAWTQETGHGNWNVDRAVEAWTQAVDALIVRAPKAGEAWFVLGNDFFNVDNQDETTTNGTPQDEDGRWQQTFQRGLCLMHETIAKLSNKFPKVKIIVMPGNHDSQRSYYLGAALQEYYIATYFTTGQLKNRQDYFDNEKVKDSLPIYIDNRPGFRKYFQWGNTGIGFAHGDRLKGAELGNLCQNEARTLWGQTKRFELHLGHLHQNMVKSVGGVTVRWIPALCPPDAWHAKSGYTMSEKAAMLFVYDLEGLKDICMHYPDERIFG